MASPRFRIIDADGHVMEPRGMWERYASPAFRERAPRAVRDVHGRTRLSVAGRLCPRPEGPNSISAGMQDAFSVRVREQLGEYLQAGYSAEAQVKAMEAGGIEVAFLYPSQGLYTAALEDLDPELAIDICRAYNDWILDFCALAPERLKPVAMLVALHEPAAAVREAQRVAPRGIRAIFVRPNPIRGRNLDDPAYEPLWAECERLGLAVGVHEGVGGYLPTAGADRFTSFFAAHAACHPMEQMLAMLALIGGGVLERHPRLRVGFLEAGCGWLPYWLWRMDEHWEQTEGITGEPRLALKPSDYFRRQCWISCEPDEPYIPRVLDFIGEDRLLFASDYPHPDHKWPETVEAMLALPVPDPVKRKILWDNPAAFYDLA
ncbi:MAG: amidohydrolase family protein [Candidatus Rokubacteria bacterium]|nr:amidohydrolase family protein [Candidatus Rokubacteria bacterium]